MNLRKDHGFSHQFPPGHSVGRNLIKCTLPGPSIVRTSIHGRGGHMFGSCHSVLHILAAVKTDSMRNSAFHDVPSAWVPFQPIRTKLSSACSSEETLDWYNTPTRHNSFYFWEVLYCNSLGWHCLQNPGRQLLQSNVDCRCPQRWPGSFRNFTKNFSRVACVLSSSAGKNAPGCFPLQIWFGYFPFISELVLAKWEEKCHPKPRHMSEDAKSVEQNPK